MTENGAEVGRDPCRPGHPQERSPGLGGPCTAGGQPRGCLQLLWRVFAAAAVFFLTAVGEKLSVTAPLAYLARLSVRNACRWPFGSVRLTQAANGVGRSHPRFFRRPCSGRSRNAAVVVVSFSRAFPLPFDLPGRRTPRAVVENLLASYARQDKYFVGLMTETCHNKKSGAVGWSPRGWLVFARLVALRG